MQRSPREQYLNALSDEMELCKAVKLFRAYAGITQQQLADYVGCSKTQITRIEGGRYHEIRSTRYITSVCHMMLKLTGIAFDAEPYLNRAPQPNNKTGYRGVCYDKTRGKYMATITAFSEHFHLGRYDSVEAALEMRQMAEGKLTEGIEALRDWVQSNFSSVPYLK